MVKIYKQKGVLVADSKFVSPWKGLMFAKKLRPGEAIIMNLSDAPPVVIHMFFVFQQIDIILLDHNYVVYEVHKNVSPFRLFIKPKQSPHFIIEGNKLNLKVGDRVKFWQEKSKVYKQKE